MIGLRVLLPLLLVSSCVVLAAQPTVSNLSAQLDGARKIDSPHLPNAWQVTVKVISGGLPEGDVAFAELAKLGVKTVISVDGMTPDLKTARKHGLRYVHLPHGYDGVPDRRGRELAKAVRDLPGPIYVHCHHGRHRSPAAVAVACVEAGLISEEAAESLLKLAGTNPDYHGLFNPVRNAHRLDPAELDQLQVEFREMSPIPPLTEAMVELERAYDRVKQHAGGEQMKGEQSRAAALLLVEQYKEMQRLDVVKSRTADFQKLLVDGEAAAEELRAAVAGDSSDTAIAEAALKKLAAGCTGCHVKYRDNAGRQ